MNTLQTLATEAARWFIPGERLTDGIGLISVCKDGAPDWVKLLIREAHGDHLPDDWCYHFIENALDEFVSYDDPENAIGDCSADVYTADLTAWLASHVRRVAYLDEVRSEFGEDMDDSFNMLQRAQQFERLEVMHSVHRSLELELESRA